jgi:hypothetical protein
MQVRFVAYDLDATHHFYEELMGSILCTPTWRSCAPARAEACSMRTLVERSRKAVTG